MTTKKADIVERHDLTKLLNYVLSPEFVAGKFPRTPHDTPLRSGPGFDLAPHGQSDVYVEGADKVFREVDDAMVERLVDDVMANGYAEAQTGQLLDTRMLRDETGAKGAKGANKQKKSEQAPAAGGAGPSLKKSKSIKLTLKSSIP